jgi:hypothetical protein
MRAAFSLLTIVLFTSKLLFANNDCIDSSFDVSKYSLVEFVPNKVVFQSCTQAKLEKWAYNFKQKRTPSYPLTILVLLMHCGSEKRENLGLLRAKYLIDYLHNTYNISYTLFSIQLPDEIYTPPQDRCKHTGVFLRFLI